MRSVTSIIYRGLVENGRRYQALKEGAYFGPSDEKQFFAQEAAYFAQSTLDSQQKNPWFRAPLDDNAQHVLDIGCGGEVLGCIASLVKLTFHSWLLGN